MTGNPSPILPLLGPFPIVFNESSELEPKVIRLFDPLRTDEKLYPAVSSLPILPSKREGTGS